MSEQDNISGEVANRGSPMVVVETASGRYTGPFRPTEILDKAMPDLHQKQAPAVTSLSENWRDAAEMPTTKDLRENEIAMSSERHKLVVKKLSSQVGNRKRESHAPAIPMTPMETGSKAGELKMAPTTAWKGKPSVTPIPDVEKKKEEFEKKGDEDSITSEITELRTPEAVKKTPEWSDDEEAGGLPRSESRASRASRVTRAVRQLLCCGVQLEATSEDNMSSPRSGFFNSGI